MAYTEKYYRDCISCCEVDEGGSPCCCEGTDHKPDSLMHVLKESTQDGVKVELVFRTEEAAEEFHFKLGLNLYNS